MFSMYNSKDKRILMKYLFRHSWTYHCLYSRNKVEIDALESTSFAVGLFDPISPSSKRFAIFFLGGTTKYLYFNTWYVICEQIAIAYSSNRVLCRSRWHHFAPHLTSMYLKQQRRLDLNGLRFPVITIAVLSTTLPSFTIRCRETLLDGVLQLIVENIAWSRKSINRAHCNKILVLRWFDMD